jgi:integrase
LSSATGEPLRNYTADEWLREWLQGKKATKAKGTFLKYENAINGFLACVGNRGKFNVNQIAPRDVLRFRDAQILDGKHPSTANDRVKIVRMAFTSARKLGYITHNPADAVEMLPEDVEPAKQPFDIDQVKALLQAASGDWKGAIMVALYTGARLQDVANMRWESVDLHNKWIAFRVGKTKQRIKLPMHDALYDFLLELPAPGNGKAFLFPMSRWQRDRRQKRSFNGVCTHHGASEGARGSSAGARWRSGAHGQFFELPQFSPHAYKHHGKCWCGCGGPAEVHRPRERRNEPTLHAP